MTVTEQSRVASSDIEPMIGTEILADKAALLSGVHAAEIRELLEQRGVLVFPKIDFTDEEHVAFTKTLGKFAREIRAEEVYKVTLDTGQNASAEYLKGAFYWHIDGTMSPMPILASILSAKVLSKTGGDTEFCNTYAAYDALSDEDKAAINGLKVVHALAASQTYFDPEPTLAKFLEWKGLGRNELATGLDPPFGPQVARHQRDRASCRRHRPARGRRSTTRPACATGRPRERFVYIVTEMVGGRHPDLGQYRHDAPRHRLCARRRPPAAPDQARG